MAKFSSKLLWHILITMICNSIAGNVDTQEKYTKAKKYVEICQN